MMSFKEYKKKVYEIFISECLPDVSEKDKIDYLNSESDTIEDSYKGDVYVSEEIYKQNEITDHMIRWGICDSLEMLY